MRKNFWLPAALIAGLGLSAVAVAGPGDDGPRGHGHRGGPYMQELKDLDLSDTQKTTIKGLVGAQRDKSKDQRDATRDLRRSFDLAVPGSAEYSNAATQLAEAEATQARSQVQAEADIRSKVYQVLTPAQRSKLATELANRLEPSPPPQ